jgi:hypothetical protein
MLTTFAVPFLAHQTLMPGRGQVAALFLAGSVVRDRYDWVTWAANPLLAIVGIGGIVVALVTLGKLKRQTRAMEEAVRISQATLVSTFRPKVTVRSLNLRRTAAKADERNSCRVAYDLVNVGGTPAHVTQLEVCVHYNKGRYKDGFGDASSEVSSKDEFTLQPGEYREGFVELGTEVTQRLDYLEASSEDGVNNPELVGKIFVTGRIEYRDETSATRRTGFHRSYNQETKRFSVVPDPEYEYSD